MYINSLKNNIIVEFAVYKTKFGYFRIETSNDCVIGIFKLKQKPSDQGQENFLTNIAFNQLEQYFNQTRKSFDFKINLMGTSFQQRVWNAIAKIPYGQTRTYQQIAISIGNPKASRAVGMACNKNKLVIIIPCHRVIGSNQKLVGYGPGLAMKAQLIELETKNS